MKKNVKFNKEVIIILILFCIGISLSLLSPLNPFFSSSFLKGDSAIFAYIGKAMHEYNQVPYLDLFDHKGPFLYFINYWGYALNGLNGIWFLEVTFLLLAIFFAYKTSHLLSNNWLVASLSTFSILLFFTEYNIGGNLSESYAFTLILGAIYFYTEYILKQPERFPRFKIFLIGSFLGLVLLLRPNMIGAWGGFSIVIAIQFLYKKEYKKILQSVFYMGLGILSAILPFFIYLYSKNAFQDFILYYWSINRYYTQVSIIDFLTNIKHFSILNPFLFISFFSYAYIYLTSKKSKKNLAFGFLLSLLLSLPMMSLSGRTYHHYAIILLPTFLYAINYVYLKITNAIQNYFENSPLGFSFSIVILLLILGFYSFTTFNSIKNDLKGYSGFKELTTYIQENSSPDEKIIYIGQGSSIYLSTDRQAASKYFYQRPVADITNGIIKSSAFIDDLETNQPKFIIIQNRLNLGSYFEWDIYEYLNNVLERGSYQPVEEDNFNNDILVYIRTY